jgi:hypothetical protein
LLIPLLLLGAAYVVFQKSQRYFADML